MMESHEAYHDHVLQIGCVQILPPIQNEAVVICIFDKAY